MDAAAKRSSRSRERLLNLVKVLVSLLGLSLILLTKTDLDQVFTALRTMDWLPFVAGLMLLLAGVLVRAYRWGALVWALGVHVSWPRLVVLWFIGMFFNLFLPTGMGGDAVKMYELSRDDHRAAAAISSVLVDRFLGLFVLFAVALLALSFGRGLVGPVERTVIAGVFLASLVLAALLLQRTWIESWGRRLGLGRLLARFQILRDLYASIHLFGWRALLKSAAASLVFDLMLILGNYLLGLAVGIQLSPWYYFVFIPIISALMMLPSVGGLGVRESAYKLLFGQVVDENLALALGLAYLITLLITALIGAVLYIAQGVRGARA
jgi:glycosyltransferase 2 family protein